MEGWMEREISRMRSYRMMSFLYATSKPNCYSFYNCNIKIYQKVQYIFVAKDIPQNLYEGKEQGQRENKF